ncbi:MAG: hypothetical protein ABIE43_04435 [Patescibacteria group bacterium]
MTKSQIHKRLSNEQAKFILDKYSKGEIKAGNARAKLGVGKSRFYELFHDYENDTANFSIDYKRIDSTRKIDPEIEKNILAELEFEKVNIIDRKDVPTKRYNYSYIKNLIKEKYKQKVSLDTIIDRAKKNNYYLGKPPKKIHDREVITNFVGELIQHDSSHHMFAPNSHVKWYLITSLDDYSRAILYGDLWEQESSFKHILAAQDVVLNYGIPHAYYVDQHRIFRYIKDRDNPSSWVNYTKFTDDVDPQWKQVMIELNIDPRYALSPQAKGKIERPYQWLQDHLVRTCVRNNITRIEDARIILKDELYKYNYKRVHSTTREIPMIRFERAIRENKLLFREFKISKPDQTVKDIFCLHDTRIVNAYHKINYKKLVIDLPHAIPGQTVDLKIYPDPLTGITEIRIWHKDKFLKGFKTNEFIE